MDDAFDVDVWGNGPSTISTVFRTRNKSVIIDQHELALLAPST